MDEILEMLEKWQMWFKRVLYVSIAVLLVWGGYKWGYSAGLSDMAQYFNKYMQEKEAETQSSYIPPNTHDGEPGRMQEMGA